MNVGSVILIVNARMVAMVKSKRLTIKSGWPYINQTLRENNK